MKNLRILAALTVLTFPTFAQAQSNPNIRFCSGPSGGNYEFSALEIAKQYNSAGKGKIEVFNTRGSIENLDALRDGKCDVAIVQNDALRVYNKSNRNAQKVERLGKLYDEYVHFICNRKSKINRITQLTPAITVAIGPQGSGSSVTWESFKQSDEKLYGPIPTVPFGGLKAVEKVADGTEAQCMVFTSALKSSYVVNDIDTIHGNNLVLADADDNDFDNAKDNNQPIYQRDDIQYDTYSNLQKGLGTFGSRGKVSTVKVGAIIVSSSEFSDNDQVYNAFVRSKNAAQASILKKVQP
jgi:TRAP transporter TAXI family solute receptor